MFTPKLQLPNGSIITGGYLAIYEASNAGGTDTVATTAFSSLLLANMAELGITRAVGAGAAPTKGKGVVVIDYIVVGKSDYIVGDLAEKSERIDALNRNVPR